jgi:hypothetical protein
MFFGSAVRCELARHLPQRNTEAVVIKANEGVDLSSLPAGTRVIVETRNSRYCLVMKDEGGSNAVALGGRYCPEETDVQIHGSTLGGSLISIGWIGLGWLVELSVHGKQILTSRVRSISVEPRTV